MPLRSMGEAVSHFNVAMTYLLDITIFLITNYNIFNF